MTYNFSNSPYNYFAGQLIKKKKKLVTNNSAPLTVTIPQECDRACATGRSTPLLVVNFPIEKLMFFKNSFFFLYCFTICTHVLRHTYGVNSMAILRMNSSLYAHKTDIFHSNGFYLSIIKISLENNLFSILSFVFVKLSTIM